jgi:hypothetical protein
VLLAIFPLSVVFATIRPCEDTLAFFLIVEVITLVTTTVMPSKDASTVHLIVAPLAIILTSVGPGIDAFALNIIVEELARVSRTVSPMELAQAVLFALFVLTFITGIVWPNFFTFSMLLVFVWL